MGYRVAAGFEIGRFTPPGPVAAEFIRSDAEVPFIMGPVGSGKTMATIFKALRYTAKMPPGRDGIIRAKGAIIRTDYRTLYGTTLSSWHRWFPRDYPGSKFIGGADRPATHEIFFLTPRGKKIHLIAEFKALGTSRIEDIMRGWEGSWAWLNEVDLQDEDSLTYSFQRTTRWPPRELLATDPATGEPYNLRPRVFGDLNPPGDPDHWIVKRFLEGKPLMIDGRQVEMTLFQQPSGLSPQAENRQNLPRGYYEGIASMADAYHVHRFVHGKIGYDRSGMPVFPEFDPALNCAPLEPDPTLPLHLGFDASGLHPAAVICQRRRNLQLVVLEEVYIDRAGATRFLEAVAAALAARYPNYDLATSFYDPSNDYGADREGGDLTTIDTIRKALFPIGQGPLVPAPSNEVPLRLEAVRNLIVMPVPTKAGMARGLIVDPRRCPMLVKGFMSHYRYLVTPGGAVRNADKPRPEKGKGYDNVQDALQYPALGLQGVAGAVRVAAKGFRPGAIGARPENFVAKTEFRL